MHLLQRLVKFAVVVFAALAQAEWRYLRTWRKK